MNCLTCGKKQTRKLIVTPFSREWVTFPCRDYVEHRSQSILDDLRDGKLIPAKRAENGYKL